MRHERFGQCERAKVIGRESHVPTEALDHQVERLGEDHANARALAEVLNASPAFEVDLATVQTNIVIARLAPEAPDAATLVAKARAAGVLVFQFGPRMIRATTYLGVARRECLKAGEVLVGAAGLG